MKLTYFWQIEWDGLKAMKFETGQTFFFSDVVAPLSSTGSRDENVTLPDTTMATPASENVIRLLKGIYKNKFFLLILCVETSLLTLLASVDFYEGRFYSCRQINPLFLRASFVISFNLHLFGEFVVVTINAPREF